LVLLDVDSIPDANNDEDPVEDEIDNDQGDEDDHDRAGVVIRSSTPVPPAVPFTSPPLESPTITNPPPPPPSTPQPLALTGSNSNRLASAGVVVMALGGVVLVAASRMRREDDEDGDPFDSVR
jgi:hypothetical protein